MLKLFNLMKYYLFILSFISLALGELWYIYTMEYYATEIKKEFLHLQQHGWK